ncbi:glycoside hydrolase family 97 catalytic domain-containing protein [Bacteroides sp. GD17]|jgi:alpha-glucosidase|uniref:glycoside hydrolase family 97 protein n=1 Tax=Bacteroides sp. GD17 TaxID=3139826 RepID=UPI0025E66007|nr:glycoside hydrolase family 97 protein [uncultured Bacteroides sp.]
MKYTAMVMGLLLFLCSACGEKAEVTSPDGRNTLTLTLDESGSLYYRILSGENEVVRKSLMGIAAENEKYSFNKGLTYIGRTERNINETYTLPTGKRSKYVNKANEKTFTYRNGENQLLKVICRAYDDGIAFRYELDNEEPVTIRQELTECALADGTHTWMMDWIKDYENFYPERVLDTITSPKEFMLPVLTLQGEQWMLMTEAEVYTLPAMHLSKEANAATFHYEYAREDPTFEGEPSFKTSWKTFIMGKNLGDIVESSLVENLNPPTDFTDTDWIKPGVAAFPWWGNYLANSYIDTLKMYVDMAAEMKWDWLEFDVSLINTPIHSSKEWENVTWIPELTAYAKEKNIRVYGWDEINVLDNKAGRDYVFDRYKEMGLDGIKIDYIDSDSKYAMMFRDTACAEAAKRKMMVSFHGETLPRGHRRRYPNIMTNEGVRGAEYYTFRGVQCPNGRHNCTLPFTRNVVGSMDYTPVTFTIRDENPRTTTYAHELALAFAFESGWVCMADRPAAYLNSPARPLLEKIEAAWDEIRFIDGYPGKYFCVARCKDGKWFVAGINSDQRRKISVPLSFLGKGEHTVTLYADKEADALHDVRIETRSGLSADDTMEIDVLPNGGFVLDID